MHLVSPLYVHLRDFMGSRKAGFVAAVSDFALIDDLGIVATL
jgi:hypothetical protein